MVNNVISGKRLQEIWDNLVERYKEITKKRGISKEDAQKLSDISYEAQKYIQEFLAAKYDMNQLIDLLNSDEVILEWYEKLKKIGANIDINNIVKRCSTSFVEEHWSWLCKHGANIDKMAWKCFGDYEHICCAADLERILKKAPEIKPSTAYSLANNLILAPHKDFHANEVEVVFSVLAKHGLEPSFFENWLKENKDKHWIYSLIIDDIMRGKCDDFVPNRRKYIDEWCRTQAKEYIGRLSGIPNLVPAEVYLNHVTVGQIVKKYNNGIELVSEFPGSNQLLAERALKEFGGYPKDIQQAELLIALLDNPRKDPLPIDANKLASAVDTSDMDDDQKGYFHYVLEKYKVNPVLLKKFEVTNH